MSLPLANWLWNKRERGEITDDEFAFWGTFHHYLHTLLELEQGD
jgi:hypothetical protein